MNEENTEVDCKSIRERKTASGCFRTAKPHREQLIKQSAIK